jgi:inorganic pyrophosphatase
MKQPGAYNKKTDSIPVIIETPFNSRNKFAYDKDTGFFRLKKILPAGMTFPCDFGFIPSTKGEDGDPLDALVLMDSVTYPGCLIECRVIGAIKAEQTEKNDKKTRNDRFIMVPANMKEYDHLKNVDDLNRNKLDAIVAFFENYNRQEGKKFKLLEIADSAGAKKILKHTGLK